MTVAVSAVDSLSPIGFQEPQSTRDLHDAAIRVCDVVIASLLLLFCLPLFLIIAIALAPTGNVFFAQRRMGRNGEEFRCLKFRSMVMDAEQRLIRLLETDPAAREEWAIAQKLKNDPRITPLGQFLRKTSLDELPQLINILMGTMSLVGPRPIVRAEIPRYGRYIETYYTVRPGLTGLWQVSGRSDVSYRRRVALDVLYVKNRSLFAYMLIVTKTPFMVIASQGSY
jgi:exopolysaccharide production protein ExoY